MSCGVMCARSSRSTASDMRHTLRHYQKDTVCAVFDALQNDYNRILYTSATSTGKSIVIADLCDKFLNEYKWKVLVVVHRSEIVQQLYCDIRDYSDLTDWIDISVEQATEHADKSCRVIVGNIATVRNANRLQYWTPDVIIIDEAHRAAARSYRMVMSRYPDAIVIGCTATAKRTDKQALYALMPDESPVMLIDPKTKKQRIADPSETVFEILAFDYSMLEGVDDGWLVPTFGDRVLTNIDISNVKTAMNAEGEVDLVQSQLVAVLEKDTDAIKERVQKAYQGWKERMQDRPTIAFWPGVKTAKIADLYWKEQGHKSAELNGESENEDVGKRKRVLQEFKAGKLQIIHNVSLFTEGVNVTNCSGIIAAAPTKSWNRYVQQVGRGGRPTIGEMLNTIPTREGRRQAIAESDKRDCYVLDVIDVSKNFNLCAAPSMLDLPATFDLKGHSVSEAKKLMDAVVNADELIHEKCPFDYEELNIVLQSVELLRSVGHNNQKPWKVAPGGSLKCVKCPPGYNMKLSAEGDMQRLVIDKQGEILYDKMGHPRETYEEYTTRAYEVGMKVIDTHRKAQPAKPLGTMAKILASKDGGRGTLYYLKQAGFTADAIDALKWPGQVQMIIKPLREAYLAKKNAASE